MRSFLLFLISQSYFLGLAFLVASGLVFAEIVRKVNHQRTDPMSYLHSQREILREYHRMYPSDRLALYYSILAYAGLALLAVCLWRIRYSH
jgi:hypothetical protein